jgi:hypothetical protein
MLGDFLTQVGIRMPELFAAFSGGVVAALLITGSKPNVWGIFSSIIVGTLTGIWLGPIIPPVFGFKASSGATFGVGLAGAPICRGILAAAQRVKWSPAPNGKADGGKSDV